MLVIHIGKGRVDLGSLQFSDHENSIIQVIQVYFSSISFFKYH